MRSHPPHTHTAVTVHTQVLAALSHQGHFPLQSRKLSLCFRSEALLVPSMASVRHHAHPRLGSFLEQKDREERGPSWVQVIWWSICCYRCLVCQGLPAGASHPLQAQPPLSQQGPGREGMRSRLRRDALVRIRPFPEKSLHLDKLLCAGLPG